MVRSAGSAVFFSRVLHIFTAGFVSFGGDMSTRGPGATVMPPLGMCPAQMINAPISPDDAHGPIPQGGRAPGKRMVRLRGNFVGTSDRGGGKGG